MSTKLLNDAKLVKYLNYAIDGKNGLEYDVARILCRIFKDDYVCGKIKSKIWYHFEGNKWTQIESGPYTELSSSIVKIFYYYQEKLRRDIKEKNINTREELYDATEEMELVEKKIKKIDEIIGKLKSVKFKESVCRESLYLFHRPDFMTQLDRKTYLICFSNGVWDIKKNEFREGKREDMILLSIGSEYVKGEEANMEEVMDKFKEYRRKILMKRSPKDIFFA